MESSGLLILQLEPVWNGHLCTTNWMMWGKESLQLLSRCTHTLLGGMGQIGEALDDMYQPPRSHLTCKPQMSTGSFFSATASLHYCTSKWDVIMWYGKESISLSYLLRPSKPVLICITQLMKASDGMYQLSMHHITSKPAKGQLAHFACQSQPSAAILAS